MRRAVVGSLLALLAGCATTIPRPSLVEDAAQRLMRRESVQGLAYAVIDDGRVVQVRALGLRNVERALPLDVDSIVYAASLVKTAFAYRVLQLVDEGRLDLDASIATSLPRPLADYPRWKDLAADDRWRRITPRMLLSHSSGLANFRWLEPDQRPRLHFDPGTRYAYSGEGMQLLQFILAETLEPDLGTAMQARVFDRFGMTRTSMTWRSDFADDVADNHDVDGHVVPHRRRSRPDAAGSMDTTIADQARFWAALVRGDGLTAASRAALVAAQIPIASAYQFPTLALDDSPENAAVGLASGLGVVRFGADGGRGWYKAGHDEGTANLALCIETRRRCVVLLSNDVRAERLYPEFVRFVLGPVSMRWAWEYGDARPAL